jgi:hypothetical protein
MPKKSDIIKGLPITEKIKIKIVSVSIHEDLRQKLDNISSGNTMNDTIKALYDYFVKHNECDSI